MKYLLILLIFLFSSCNDFIDTWEGYQIDKGENHSHRIGMPDRLIGLQSGRHMKFDAYFGEGTLYDTAGLSKQTFTDINKLYGFCDANSSVNDNSIRMGWRHDGAGKIEIFAYWHRSGKFGYEKLGETIPYQKDEYELWARNGFYEFRFNDIVFKTERAVDAEHGLRVRLWFYFGGDAKAPQDMQVFIREHD